MHWSIHKHGNMAIWHSIEQFAAFCAIKCMTSGCFFSHLGTSGWVKLDYFPKGEKTENTRIDRFKSLETRIHLTMRSSKSISKMGALAEWIKPCLFFLLFIFPTTFFGLVDRRFFVETLRKNTSSVVMEEYSKWAMDSKQNLHTFNRSWMSRCLSILLGKAAQFQPPEVSLQEVTIFGEEDSLSKLTWTHKPLEIWRMDPPRKCQVSSSHLLKKKYQSMAGLPEYFNLVGCWCKKKITSIISVKVFRMRCQTRIQGD